jgi:hypothetical protein
MNCIMLIVSLLFSESSYTTTAFQLPYFVNVLQASGSVTGDFSSNHELVASCPAGPPKGGLGPLMNWSCLNDSFAVWSACYLAVRKFPTPVIVANPKLFSLKLLVMDEK